MRKGKDSGPFRTVVRQNRLVVLPPGLSGFRLGQRVFFSVRGPSIVVTPKPKGVWRGRLQSSRIRRRVWSQSAHGQRRRGL